MGNNVHLAHNDPARFKYLIEVIPHMALRFRTLGIPHSAIEVRMFGGANVLPGARTNNSRTRPLGEVNIQTARDLILQASLIIDEENVGGNIGRKIHFNTFTGEVEHHSLSRINRAFPL